jgi:hypothetical protein
MGRKKKSIERVLKSADRHVTFVKRAGGLIKKAHELHILTGSQCMLILPNEDKSITKVYCTSGSIDYDLSVVLNNFKQGRYMEVSSPKDFTPFTTIHKDGQRYVEYISKPYCYVKNPSDRATGQKANSKRRAEPADREPKKHKQEDQASADEESKTILSDMVQSVKEVTIKQEPVDSDDDVPMFIGTSSNNLRNRVF